VGAIAFYCGKYLFLQIFLSYFLLFGPNMAFWPQAGLAGIRGIAFGEFGEKEEPKCFSAEYCLRGCRLSA
jgi:hypothetical protein